MLFAWCLGVGLVAALPRLPGDWSLAWAVVVVLLVAAMILRRRRIAPALLIAAALAGGFAWSGERASARLASWLPEELAGIDLTLVGRIEGLPRRGESAERIVFRSESIETVIPNGLSVPDRLLLSRYARPFGTRQVAAADAAPAPPFRAGERWRLTVRLKPPHGSVNPGGFDFEAWLLERGIGATGYVRDSPSAELLGEADGIGAKIDRRREAIRARLHRAMAGEPYAGVIVALAIGDQDAIDDAGWALFNRTGTTHLMSISGLHVTLLAALLAALTGFVWRRVPWLVDRIPSRRAALLAGALAALAYAALAGFGIPAQRTVLMLGVVVVAMLSGRAVSARRVLLLALAVVLAIDPWAVLAPGFWLSFATVAVLLVSSGGQEGGEGSVGRRARRAVAGFGRSQWFATIATVPFLAAAFHRLSLISPLANAVAIPAIGFVIAPLAVAAALLPVDAIAQFAHALLAALMVVIEALGALPWAVLHLPEVSGLAIGLALTGVALLTLPAGMPVRWLGLVLFLPVLAPPTTVPVDGEARVSFLDIGHGLAVIVRTHRHTLLFDAGPALPGRFDAGERVVVPALRALGVGRIDTLLISHEDSDHAGGAAAVLRELPVAALVGSLPDGHALRRGETPYRRCVAGEGWQWDGVDFTFLHPPATAFDDPRRTRNRLSCALRITAAGGQSLLITADLEGADEARLVREMAPALRAQVMQVPHQGSKHSSTPAFVEAVGARAVVVPAGYRNPYGHPHPEVVARYARAGARLWRTDRDGAVSVELGAQLTVTGLRGERPRYWRRSDTIADLRAAGDAE